MAVMMKRHWLEIRANTGDTDGARFLNQAKHALGVWGGMSHSVGVVNDDGEVSISFTPDYADGGVPAVVEWLDSLEIPYTLELHRWAAES